MPRSRCSPARRSLPAGGVVAPAALAKRDSEQLSARAAAGVCRRGPAGRVWDDRRRVAESHSSAIPTLHGLALEAVEWLPSGADSGLVRVRGRWTDAAARQPGLPVLCAARRRGGAPLRVAARRAASRATRASWRGHLPRAGRARGRRARGAVARVGRRRALRPAGAGARARAAARRPARLSGPRSPRSRAAR